MEWDQFSAGSAYDSILVTSSLQEEDNHQRASNEDEIHKKKDET